MEVGSWRYEGPEFRLKLVRYYENYPLHFTGEVFRIQCGSELTRDSPAHKTQDAGWLSLGGGAALGSKSAAEVAERERGRYRVVDDRTLVWLGNGVKVSFDACGSFRAWYPPSLPEGIVVPAEKPDFCKPRGATDCAHLDFVGDREPRFDEIRVSPEGGISFRVRSRAFRQDSTVRVDSEDFGRSWEVTVLERPTG